MPPPEEIDGFHLVEPAATTPWPVYRAGTGPPVVLMHEVMGLTEPVLAFATRLVTAGFTTYLPVLAGPAPARSGLDKVRAAGRICVSREFDTLRTGRTSKVVAPLKDLARYASAQAGGGGVGVIGMCFSGGFALALAADESVLASVVAEPALPFAVPFVPACKRALGASAEDVRAVAARLADGKVEVYVTRFSRDWMSPAERARALSDALGVEVHEIDSGKGNPGRFTWKDHSVLSMAPYAHAKDPDAMRELDRAAAEVVAFLHRRLAP